MVLGFFQTAKEAVLTNLYAYKYSMGRILLQKLLVYKVVSLSFLSHYPPAG